MDSDLKSTEEGSVHSPEHLIRMGKEMAQRVPVDGAGDVQPRPMVTSERCRCDSWAMEVGGQFNAPSWDQEQDGAGQARKLAAVTIPYRQSRCCSLDLPLIC